MKTHPIRSDVPWKNFLERDYKAGYCVLNEEDPYFFDKLKGAVMFGRGQFIYLMSDEKTSEIVAATGVSIDKAETYGSGFSITVKQLQVHFYFLSPAHPKLKKTLLSKLFCEITRYGEAREYQIVKVPCLLGKEFLPLRILFKKFPEPIPDKNNPNLVWYDVQRSQFESLCDLA